MKCLPHLQIKFGAMDDNEIKQNGAYLMKRILISFDEERSDAFCQRIVGVFSQRGY